MQRLWMYVYNQSNADFSGYWQDEPKYAHMPSPSRAGARHTLMAMSLTLFFLLCLSGRQEDTALFVHAIQGREWTQTIVYVKYISYMQYSEVTICFKLYIFYSVFTFTSMFPACMNKRWYDLTLSDHSVRDCHLWTWPGTSKQPPSYTQRDKHTHTDNTLMYM